MSTMKWGMVYSRNAGVNLTDKLHHLARVNTDGDIILAGDGTVAIGVITEEAALGKAATVQLTGIAKVILAETVAANARIASDANGQAVAAAVGDFEVGTLLSGGDAGEIVEVFLSSGRRHA